MQIDLVVNDLCEKERLDVYVSRNLENFSRSRLKTCAKIIFLNGKPAKLSNNVKKNDVIHIEWDNIVPKQIEAQDIPLDILFEDENICVINKKQGMVVHPAKGNWSGTLVNALLFHFRGENIVLPDKMLNETANKSVNLRPGIVHRLDKDTSGVIITAKNVESELFLQNQFRCHKVKKIYIAIVRGVPKQKSGEVKINIVRDSRNRKRFTTTTQQQTGKFSHTIYRCIASYGPYTLIKFRLMTGRTHQIRVHAKYLGISILGDPIYGKKDKIFGTATLMLHSSRITIKKPVTEEVLTIKSPTPIRFKKVMSKLHKMYPKIAYCEAKTKND